MLIGMSSKLKKQNKTIDMSDKKYGAITCNCKQMILWLEYWTRWGNSSLLLYFKSSFKQLTVKIPPHLAQRASKWSSKWSLGL